MLTAWHPADGKQLEGQGLSKRILKEGTQIDVTTSKSDEGTETDS
jgi:hypothetical protein